jgi:hypothetical protein
MRRSRRRRWILGLNLLVILAALALIGCGDDDDDDDDGGDDGVDLGEAVISQAEDINPADFSADITNPFFPQPVGQGRVYEGEEEGVSIRIEEEVLAETETVAGVEVRPLEVNEYEDDELTEHTLDYFAQHSDGSVWYFGEDVDNYEDGELVDHEGAWLAGEGENLPGLFMPASPEVGQQFAPERAPGIAEDEVEILEVGVAVETPAGSFDDCIRNEEFNPLEDATESEFYCRDVGLAREEAEEVFVELIEVS